MRDCAKILCKYANEWVAGKRKAPAHEQTPGFPEEYREDPEATITLSQFRALAWEVANEAARQLGWIRSCNDLHEAAKLAGTAI